MLAQEGGDLELILSRTRLGPAIGVMLAGSTARSRGATRVSGLYGRPGGSIVRSRIGGIIFSLTLVGAEGKTDIRGQPLEQGAGILGFGIVLFLRDL